MCCLYITVSSRFSLEKKGFEWAKLSALEGVMCISVLHNIMSSKVMLPYHDCRSVTPCPRWWPAQTSYIAGGRNYSEFQGGGNPWQSSPTYQHQCRSSCWQQSEMVHGDKMCWLSGLVNIAIWLNWSLGQVMICWDIIFVLDRYSSCSIDMWRILLLYNSYNRPSLELLVYYKRV